MDAVTYSLALVGTQSFEGKQNFTMVSFILIMYNLPPSPRLIKTAFGKSGLRLHVGGQHFIPKVCVKNL